MRETEQTFELCGYMRARTLSVNGATTSAVEEVEVIEADVDAGARISHNKENYEHVFRWS